MPQNQKLVIRKKARSSIDCAENCLFREVESDGNVAGVAGWEYIKVEGG